MTQLLDIEKLNAQIQQLETRRSQPQAHADEQRKEAVTSVIQELIEKKSMLTASPLRILIWASAGLAKPAKRNAPASR